MAKTKAGSKPAASRAGRAGAPRPKVADPLDLRLAAVQRGVLCALVALSAVVFWRPLLEPFMLPKITVIVLGAVVLLVLAAVRAVRTGQVVLPAGPPLWLSLALASALVLATVTADRVGMSLVGEHGRYGGLWAYLSYLTVFLVALRLYAAERAQKLVVALLLALGLVLGYGIVQLLGLDPFTWSSAGLDQTFSTMGNVNFAAGYVAMVVPVAAAVAVLPGSSTGWRLAGVGLLAAAGWYLLENGSAQGPLAALAGLAVVACVWLRGRRRARPLPVSPRWLALGGLVAVCGLGLGVVLLAPSLLDGLGERRYFWRAALAVFADHPVLGTGLDSFRDYFTRYRAPEHAVAIGYDSADSPHNQPLSMLAYGGLPLGLAYLAFVGWTGWVLVRGLLAPVAGRVLPLAAFGGMWVAYQVQSLVSVDVPPLTLLHFLSAALVLATVGRAATASLAVPLTPAGRGRVLPRGGAARVTAAVLAVLLVAGASAAWLALRPLRADLAAGQAARSSDPEVAVARLDHAVGLAPWEAEYRIRQANARSRAGDDRTYASVLAAAELRRGSSLLALSVVDSAELRSEDDIAVEWLERAVTRDPNNPALLEEVAGRLEARGDTEQAAALAERAAFLRANHADY